MFLAQSLSKKEWKSSGAAFLSPPPALPSALQDLQPSGCSGFTATPVRLKTCELIGSLNSSKSYVAGGWVRSTSWMILQKPLWIAWSIFPHQLGALSENNSCIPAALFACGRSVWWCGREGSGSCKLFKIIQGPSSRPWIDFWQLQVQAIQAITCSFDLLAVL